MNLALQNVRTVQTADGARLVAELVATNYGFSIETSLWAEVLQSYGPALTQLALVKEAILSAQAKVMEKKAVASQNLIQAQARVFPQPVAPAVDAPQEQQDAYAQALVAYQQAQDALTAAQTYSNALARFETEMTAEIPVRVNAFYTALLAKFAADPDRVKVYQAEWDAWKATQVDLTGLAGVLPPG